MKTIKCEDSLSPTMNNRRLNHWSLIWNKRCTAWSLRMRDSTPSCKNNRFMISNNNYSTLTSRKIRDWSIYASNKCKTKRHWSKELKSCRQNWKTKLLFDIQSILERKFFIFRSKNKRAVIPFGLLLFVDVFWNNRFDY